MSIFSSISEENFDAVKTKVRFNSEDLEKHEALLKAHEARLGRISEQLNALEKQVTDFEQKMVLDLQALNTSFPKLVKETEDKIRFDFKDFDSNKFVLRRDFDELEKNFNQVWGDMDYLRDEFKKHYKRDSLNKKAVDWESVKLVREMLEKGVQVSEIAKTLGIARNTVYRYERRYIPQLVALEEDEAGVESVKPGGSTV